MNKKEREIFKQKVEQYPVIIDRENAIDGKAQLLHFKDRVKDLDLNLIFGSDLSHSKYKNIHNDSLYLIGKQLQKPFYLGNSLEEVKQKIMADGEAEDYGPRYVQQYGYGILTNKKVGRTTAIYAHEKFDELPTEEDAISYAKDFYKRPDISRFSQPTKDRDAERANLSTSSLNSELSYHETHSKTIDDDCAKANIVLKPTSIIKGLEWNQKQDIYYYNPKNKKEPQLIGKDLESFADYLNEPAKINGLSTTRVDINREHFAKTHQDQVKNIQRNLYIGRDKNANEDLFKKYLRRYDIYINPSKRDFEDANVLWGLSKDTNLDKVVEKMEEPKQEKAIGYIKANSKKTKATPNFARRENRENAKRILEEYGFDTTEENIKKMAKNIEIEDKFNKQLKIKKSGLESVKLELADPEIRKNYAETYGKKTEIDKKTEQVFLEKPIYSQWFMQRNRAEKEYEDLKKLGFPSSYQGEEKQNLRRLSQKIPVHTIRKLENAYVATRDIYFNEKTAEVKNISLVSKTTRAKIEKNSKKFLAIEHKKASRNKKLER
ncbi:hypothetical protein [Lactobacillus taiwanensis]|uniref:hypothetical protein n=1 Tax=Lactobacillus taiwanensis TaxID=508451 RepID=UPI0015C5F872|nr:hypothetical protein [Lactobacillus taiwanensis]